MTEVTTREDGDRRLLMLAALLENLKAELPDVKFDMAEWRCGTAACAISAAALYAPFIAEGLCLSFRHYGYRPTYHRYEGLSAAVIFFELDQAEAEWLFLPESCPSHVRPRTVAKRIRKFVAERPA